tara:strand:- start:381 stop:1376 length:996 start_codon:yes stop_codon:yes gene_type:complete
MIIISRCPYRISLLGGGSDLDWFVKDNSYGLSLGYALSKYTYTVINQLPASSKRGILNYSSREEYTDINDIAHPLIKSAFEEFKFMGLLEISSFGFASRGSGLGGSSSFLNAILKGLSFLNKKELNNDELAFMASNIEINKLNKPIGRQDHFLSAAGNFSCLKFLNQNNEVNRINLDECKQKFLEKETNKLYLIPSFISRSADKVLSKLKDSPNTKDYLLKIRSIAEKFIFLEDDREYVLEETFNNCVKESWEIKRKMSGVMSGILNEQYEQIKKIPTNWIRLLGAGSGGYFLISSKLNEKRTKEELLKNGIKDFFKASLSKSGAEIVHFS